MDPLHTLSCEPCRAGSSALDEQEAEALLTRLPGWKLERHADVLRLTRTYSLPDFREALALTNRIAELAEREDHHPLIQLEWGKVVVQWWTHRIDGLHLNDFIMAARTDLATDC